MSDAQLALTAPAEEETEDVVVERFIAASREIVPTVQVSLAKRIFHPGSGRVICLAAHTSVPLNDDEMHSVSDLALKLSDGTNVRLSLSFFNDGTAAAAPPPSYRSFPQPRTYDFGRSTYDPGRYTVHTVQSGSKLAPVLFATVLGAAVGLFYVAGGPVGLRFPGIPSANTAAVSKAVPVTKPAHKSTIAQERPATAEHEAQAISTPVAAGAGTQVSQPTTALARSFNPARFEPKSRNWGRKHSRRSHADVAQSRSTTTSMDSFVPPPPPTVEAAMPKRGRGNMFVPPPPPFIPSFSPLDQPQLLQAQMAATKAATMATKAPILSSASPAAAKPSVTASAKPAVTAAAKPVSPSAPALKASQPLAAQPFVSPPVAAQPPATRSIAPPAKATLLEKIGAVNPGAWNTNAAPAMAPPVSRPVVAAPRQEMIVEKRGGNIQEIRSSSAIEYTPAAAPLPGETQLERIAPPDAQ